MVFLNLANLSFLVITVGIKTASIATRGALRGECCAMQNRIEDRNVQERRGEYRRGKERSGQGMTVKERSGEWIT